MRESQIEAYLVKRVKELGGEVRKVKWIGRRSAPDRVVMLPARRLTNTLDCAWCNPKGVVLWVELKATGKKATRAQVREHERMRKMGQRVEVIDNFEGVERLLRCL